MTREADLQQATFANPTTLGAVPVDEVILDPGKLIDESIRLNLYNHVLEYNALVKPLANGDDSGISADYQ